MGVDDSPGTRSHRSKWVRDKSGSTVQALPWSCETSRQTHREESRAARSAWLKTGFGILHRWLLLQAASRSHTAFIIAACQLGIVARFRSGLFGWQMKNETRRLNKLTGVSRSVAKRYKLTTAAAEIIDRAGQIHGQKSRAVQIAVEILWRSTGLGKIPTAILESPITARTYKIPERTVSLIEALARRGSRTRGEVLAACAGLLASDV